MIGNDTARTSLENPAHTTRVDDSRVRSAGGFVTVSGRIREHCWTAATRRDSWITAMGTHPSNQQPEEQESTPPDTKRPEKAEPDYQSDRPAEGTDQDQKKSGPDPW